MVKICVPCVSPFLAALGFPPFVLSVFASMHVRRSGQHIAVPHGVCVFWAAMEAEDSVDQRFYNSLLVELSDVYVSTCAVR